MSTTSVTTLHRLSPRANHVLPSPAVTVAARQHCAQSPAIERLPVWGSGPSYFSLLPTPLSFSATWPGWSLVAVESPISCRTGASESRAIKGAERQPPACQNASNTSSSIQSHPPFKKGTIATMRHTHKGPGRRSGLASRWAASVPTHFWTTHLGATVLKTSFNARHTIISVLAGNGASLSIRINTIYMASSIPVEPATPTTQRSLRFT